MRISESDPHRAEEGMAGRMEPLTTRNNGDEMKGPLT